MSNINFLLKLLLHTPCVPLSPLLPTLLRPQIRQDTTAPAGSPPPPLLVPVLPFLLSSCLPRLFLVTFQARSFSHASSFSVAVLRCSSCLTTASQQAKPLLLLLFAQRQTDGQGLSAFKICSQWARDVVRNIETERKRGKQIHIDCYHLWNHPVGHNDVWDRSIQRLFPNQAGQCLRDTLPRFTSK